MPPMILIQTCPAEVLHTILGYGTERATMVIVHQAGDLSTGQRKRNQMIAVLPNFLQGQSVVVSALFRMGSSVVERIPA